MVGFSHSINNLSTPSISKGEKSKQCKTNVKIQSGGGNPLPQRAIAKKRKPQIEIKRTKPKTKKRKH